MPLRYNNKRRRTKALRQRSGKKLSFNDLSPKNIWENLKALFTTKEGLKKLGTFFIIMLGIIIGLFGWYAKDLPTPNKINSRFAAQTTQIFDRNGKLLYEMHGDQNRILVDFNDIPANMKDATIAIEEKTSINTVDFPVLVFSELLFIA
jgi:membrane peptidoglycan carboxypeptidase